MLIICSENPTYFLVDSTKGKHLKTTTLTYWRIELRQDPEVCPDSQRESGQAKMTMTMTMAMAMAMMMIMVMMMMMTMTTLIFC